MEAPPAMINELFVQHARIYTSAGRHKPMLLIKHLHVTLSSASVLHMRAVDSMRTALGGIGCVQFLKQCFTTGQLRSVCDLVCVRLPKRPRAQSPSSRFRHFSHYPCQFINASRPLQRRSITCSRRRTSSRSSLKGGSSNRSCCRWEFCQSLGLGQSLGTCPFQSLKD